jgi:hypothetical protein
MLLTLSLIKCPQFPLGNPPTVGSCGQIGKFKRGKSFHCVLRIIIRLIILNISDSSKNSDKLVSYQLLCLETSRVGGQLWKPNLSTVDLLKSADCHVVEWVYKSVEDWWKYDWKGKPRYPVPLVCTAKAPGGTRGLGRGFHDSKPSYNCTIFTA